MGDTVKLMNFVSEQEVEEIKAQNGERVQDGTAQPQRPLFEILAEAKHAKDEEFNTRFKHLPPKSLDEDETEFLENFNKYTREKEREVKEEESRAIEEFQTAIASRTVSIAEPPPTRSIKLDNDVSEQTAAKKRQRDQHKLFPKFIVKPQLKRTKDGGSGGSPVESNNKEDEGHRSLGVPRNENSRNSLSTTLGNQAHPAAISLGLVSYGSDDEDDD